MTQLELRQRELFESLYSQKYLIERYHWNKYVSPITEQAFQDFKIKTWREVEASK